VGTRPVEHIRALSFEGYYLERNMVETILPLFPRITCLRSELGHSSFTPLLISKEGVVCGQSISRNEEILSTVFKNLLPKEDDSLGFNYRPLSENLEITGLHFSSVRLSKLQELMNARTGDIHDGHIKLQPSFDAANVHTTEGIVWG